MDFPAFKIEQGGKKGRTPDPARETHAFTANSAPEPRRSPAPPPSSPRSGLLCAGPLRRSPAALSPPAAAQGR
jgi:hypothetical protein